MKSDVFWGTVMYIEKKSDCIFTDLWIAKYFGKVTKSDCIYISIFSDLRSSLVSWCFEPSQPLGIISGLKRNSTPSLHTSHLKPPTFLQHS